MSHMPPECGGPCYCGPDPAVPALLTALKAARMGFDPSDAAGNSYIMAIDAAIASVEGVPPPVEEYPDNGPTDPWQTSGPGGAP